MIIKSSPMSLCKALDSLAIDGSDRTFVSNIEIGKKESLETA
jgi:hypothetical protein